MSWTGSSKSALAFRPVGPEDDGLLWALFRAGREEEVASWGWGADQADAFVRMQWQTERRARAMQFPKADHRVVMADGEPVGRVLVDDQGDRLLVVDIALLAEARGRGIGTEILRGLMADAEERGVSVVLSVSHGNPAERLYRRLGFRVSDVNEILSNMVYSPLPRDAAAAGSRSET